MFPELGEYMKVLVSACLLGENCKYNGKNNRNEAVLRFVEDKEVISICPELLTGLGAPRTPVELSRGRVVDREGKDRDALYRKGVEMALEQIWILTLPFFSRVVLPAEYARFMTVPLQGERLMGWEFLPVS